MNGFIDLFGGGNAGIAQRIIEDVFLADDLGLLQTIGKELPDHGRSGAQLIKSLIDHIFLLLYNFSIALFLPGIKSGDGNTAAAFGSEWDLIKRGISSG